ncbi:MAG: sterol desaturase family protein [Pseudomonadota bacterium]
MYTQDFPILFAGFVLLLALVEYVWRTRSGRGYDMGSLGANLGIIIVGRLTTQLLTGGVILTTYFALFTLAPWKLSTGEAWVWVAGFFVLEFFYYWQHRFSHTIRWMWASHSVHHSTNEFTLPASFRLSWFGVAGGGWLVLSPMVLLGFHPIMVVTLFSLNLRFQYFLHTEAVGKLGPLEYVFNTPSHHRVHHGSNEAYLDKNYGGVFIIFDRLFGTFAEEREDDPVIYGLTTKLESNNPITINLHEWRNMARDAARAGSLRAVWRALFGRPSDGPLANEALSSSPALIEPSRADLT